MKLLETMERYLAEENIPFHMPGHKRCTTGVWPQSVMKRDVTEVDELDDLHHADGAIAELQSWISDLYGSRRSYCLVNGSTGGVLSAMWAVSRPGDHILIARNCHKSVYHGLQLLGLRPCYLYPPVSAEGFALGITAAQVEHALEQAGRVNRLPIAMVLTSPTYEGVLSEVEAIAGCLHKRGIPLIVDEAHGAHLRYHAAFPATAVEAGADLVIQSLHKTLPALTQTALLHRQGDLVDAQRLAYALQMFQTSSPSYVFLQNIESCLTFVQEPSRWQSYVERLQSLRERLFGLAGGQPALWKPDEEVRGLYDPSKLVLLAPGRGEQLYRSLRTRFSIQAELWQPDHCLLMTSAADSPEAYERLFLAVEILGREWLTEPAAGRTATLSELPQAVVAAEPGTAVRADKQWLAPVSAIGHIAAGMVYPYPPGIPLVAPGERVTESISDMIRCYLQSGTKLQGSGLRQTEVGWELAVMKEEGL